MGLWWMSFSDPDRPRGTQFLGVAIVEAENESDMLTVSHLMGCNPGGQIQFFDFAPFKDDPDPQIQATFALPRNVLLSRDDLEAKGVRTMSEADQT